MDVGLALDELHRGESANEEDRRNGQGVDGQPTDSEDRVNDRLIGGLISHRKYPEFVT